MAADTAFKANKAAAAAASKHHTKPPAAVANPGPEPAPAPAMCPPSTAFGIAASDLPPAPGST
jgi:hypothetical protein